MNQDKTAIGRKSTKAAKEREEREFLASLPADRFGVNPRGEKPIVPKGPRKGSRRKLV